MKENGRSYHSNDYDGKYWTTKFTSDGDDLKVCYVIIFVFHKGNKHYTQGFLIK